MNKETFYQTGFYSLIALIIGFTIGSFTNIRRQRIDQITVPITIGDSVRVNTKIEKKNNKVSILKDTVKPSDKEVLSELKRQRIAHPDIVLAQAKLESGNYTSNICRNNNNLFGLMKGDDYHCFRHWKQSVTYYKNHVQNRYKGGDYYTFLSDIGYASDPKYIDKLKEFV